MNYREEVIKAGIRMLDSGLTVGTFGNVSLLGSDGLIYITPSSMDYRTLKPEDICVLNADGEMVDGLRKPSIEKTLHTEIYKARSDVHAIVHTHPVDSTAISCTGKSIPIIIDECWITLHDEVKTSTYAAPGSLELARNAAAALGEKSMACMLQSHGSVCCGGTMDEAFKVAEVLEMVAKIYIRLLSMGEDYKRIV